LIADYRDEAVESVIMRDVDGSGEAITIPGYMVNYKDARRIEDAIEKGSNVFLSSKLTLQVADKVELGLFYSSSLDLNAEEIKLFSKLILNKEKGEGIKELIIPRIHTFSCPTCPEFIQKKNCLSKGRYCAFFPKSEELSVRQNDLEDYTFAG